MVAIVLNFSFFYARVIIDAGNLAGAALYNSIAVPISEGEDYLAPAKTVITGLGGQFPAEYDKRSLTAAFMMYLQPEVLTQNENILDTSKSTLAMYTLIMTLLSFVYVFFAINFFTVSFMLITRLLWLAILIIVSPLAFITLFLPLEKVLEDKNFFR